MDSLIARSIAGWEGQPQLTWLQRIRLSLPLDQNLPLHLLKLLVTRNKLWGSSHCLKTGPLRDLSAAIEWCILGDVRPAQNPF